MIALGGNALQRRGEPADLKHQRRNLGTAARAVAEVAALHEVVVTHGNGPQVGWLAMQTGLAGGAPDYPLDLLDAGSEGMILDSSVEHVRRRGCAGVWREATTPRGRSPQGGATSPQGAGQRVALVPSAARDGPKGHTKPGARTDAKAGV